MKNVENFQNRIFFQKGYIEKTGNCKKLFLCMQGNYISLRGESDMNADNEAMETEEPSPGTVTKLRFFNFPLFF